jgi:hypothetical protein
MSFSATTCLTYTGTTSLGPILYAYSNIDGYYYSFATIPTSAITSNNCPYIITGITDSTTTIRLYDPISNCCVNIPIQSNDLCVTCDLNFTSLSSNTVSQIVAGNLTGSCDSITDYVVYWYGPNSTTNVGYISGYGTEFDYQFTHPLTGTSSIFAQSGTYIPVIDKVNVSGLTFSQTGGSGNYLANLDCFSPIIVTPLTCDNGNQPTSAYTHFYSFSGAAQGLQSPPLSVTFQIDSSINYLAWKFKGFSVTDQLTFRYSGSNYPMTLVIDNIIVGSNLTSSDTTWTNYLKSGDTSSDVSRVICLTGLTRGIGNENILINITPNVSGLTNWELSLSCLDFDCSKCTDDYLNTPYKIIASGVTAITYNNSDQIVSNFSASCYTRVNYRLSGCSTTSMTNTDIFKYYQLSSIGLQSVFNNTYGTNGILGPFGSEFSAQKLYYNQSDCDNFGSFVPTVNNFTCATSDPTSTITYTKYISGSCPSCVGVLYFEFNQAADAQHYYNSYLNAFSASSIWGYSACTSPSGVTFNNSGFTGPFSGGTSANSIPSYLDNQDYRYYRFLWLSLPTATGSTICGQNTEGGGGGFVGNYSNGLLQGYAIHPSSVVTTGVTGSNYYLQVVMNTVTNGAIFNGCAIDCTGATGVQYITNVINSSSTGSSNNITATTQTGSYYTNPFFLNLGLYLNCTSQTGYTKNGWIVFNDWSNKTLPFSSSTSPLYIYSAVTCPANGEVFTNSAIYQYLFDYEVRLLNGASTDFEIWAKSITNGSRSASYSNLALQYTGGSIVYTNPTYVIT